MDNLVVHQDQRRTSYLIRLRGKFDLDANRSYLDFSTSAKQAIRVDKNNGYDRGGPAYAQEVAKAAEYAEYVSSYANVRDLNFFNTRTGYICFSSQEPGDAIVRARKSHVRSDVSE